MAIFRNRDKDKNDRDNKDAGAAHGHDTSAAHPPSQQPGPDNRPTGSEEGSSLRDSWEESQQEIGAEGPGPARQTQPDPATGRQQPSSPPQTTYPYMGPPTQPDYRDQTVHTSHQQQHRYVTGNAGVPLAEPTFTPGPSSVGEGTHTDTAIGRHAVGPAQPSGVLAGTTPDPHVHVPGPAPGAPPHPDLAPGSDTGASAPLSPARPQIALSVPPAGADPAQAEPGAFPEPQVIGDIPTLRSDPRGLPAPDQVPGPVVPDTVLDGADFEGLRIRGASLRGDRHRYEATVRQDSMGIWRVGNREIPAVLVCVTDGVSSEPLSHRGAAEAGKLLRDLIALDVPDFFKGPKRRIKTAWAEMARDICDHLTTVARYLGVAPKALSTTLAAALIELNPQDPAQRRFVILNVGDATAYLLSDRRFSPLLADPHDTTITSTATYALPTSIGEVGVDAGTIGPGEMLMVCTDGMSNPMRNENVCAQLADWWGNGQAPSMPEFGWQMSYRAKTYDDDRTAVCVWGC